MTTDDAPAAALENVSKRYRGDGISVTALAGVSLAVRPGEMLAVTGPSGSGKSTLLHLMGALDTPTEGRVLLGGQDISRLDDAQLSRIRREEVGFVYQFFNLLPTMTALENVALPLILQGRGGARAGAAAAEALAEVGLSHRLGHMPRQLSGGEMQRVAVARAVVAAPRLVLADEPTGNLDTRSGREILDLLAALPRGRGIAVVLATHDPRSMDYATRRVEILDGRLAGGAA